MKHIAFASKYKKDFKKRSKIGRRNIRKRWDRQTEECTPISEDIPLPVTILTLAVTNHLTGSITVLDCKQAFKKNGRPAIGKYEILQNGEPWIVASKTEALSLISQRWPRVSFARDY